MATEIERKYLVINDNWKQDITGSEHMIQGYLGGNDKNSIRVRVNDEQADLNIKGRTIGIQRKEYEYSIPLAEAMELLEHLCDKPLIEKTRYFVKHVDHTWEVDVFERENAGLIVAEIELKAVDEKFASPDWLGAEVTNDVRYYNICLVNEPYSQWDN